MAPPGNLRAFLRRLVDSGAVTAASALIGDATSIVMTGAAGETSQRVKTASVFDLASLTKPVTATLALALDHAGELRLDTPIGQLVPGAHPALARKRLASLLSHRSGLRAWSPLYEHVARSDDIVSYLTGAGAGEADLLGAPPGTYSDLGFILWAELAKRAVGLSLSTLIEVYVTSPLTISALTGPPGAAAGVASCRLSNQRERQLAAAQGVSLPWRRAPRPGQVQDGNARFLGGLAGHAGAFGNASGLWRLVAEWLDPGAVLEPERLHAAFDRRGPYVLGWQRRPQASQGRKGVWFGHIGFTGGGVWFRREPAEVRILLTHRSRVSRAISDWQRQFVELELV